jgi:hypothetical protein
VNQTCTATAGAQGNCAANLVCLALGSSNAHCLPAAPCSLDAQPVTAAGGQVCAVPCSDPKDGPHTGAFIGGAPCAGGLECWENNFTAPTNDGWCIPTGT